MNQVSYKTPKGTTVTVTHHTRKTRTTTEFGQEIRTEKHDNKITVKVSEMTLSNTRRENTKEAGEAITAQYSGRHIIVPVPAEKLTEVDALYKALQDRFDAEMTKEREWDEDRRRIERAMNP